MQRATPFRIEWDAHEYEHKERSSDWFWAVGIISISISIASIIFGNIIFAILILLSAFSLALFINRPPENVHVVITERGITKDKIHYPYSTLDSYWLDSDHPHPKILLRSEKMFMPIIRIPIGDTDPVELDELLAQFLPEKYHSLPLVEKILEYLG
ncbi:MAG: hypothetical protein AAB758_01740, partial [Patescibacteria group bacterium]